MSCTYTTQMDAARQGIVTKELKAVAEKEGIEISELTELVAKGQVCIPCNKVHKCIEPNGIGSALRTKINVNLGISRDCKDMDVEMAKVKSAVDMGAEAIMDLSSFGDTRKFRKKLTSECPAVIGTVPIYDAVVYYHKALGKITSEEWIDIVKMHAEDGVDFMTIHCGINKNTAERFKKNKRLMNIVSRGGSIIFAWMEMTGRENPFYEHFDVILEICREYDITLSLGDACRPGCIADATDTSQIEELITLGELTKRAWEKDVQVMIEGPGHMPLDQIEANMKIQKTLCHGAPFYVLGPLVTDIAPGYDHITSAIGGAIAATYGASFLCYVTPAEHLRLPTLEDVKAGIIASKIAAHAADIAKGIKGAKDWDYKMSAARKKLDWEAMFGLALDPEKARRYRAESKPEKEDTCTMCGNFCAVKNMNRILDGEIVSIFDE
ncbi:MAG: phosphomethylpyrimidine synthase ThiC [Clostridiales bacterium]|nr:phosphomethylpyrimidine synthase ThiC [Clostridiales bacterium]